MFGSTQRKGRGAEAYLVGTRRGEDVATGGGARRRAKTSRWAGRRGGGARPVVAASNRKRGETGWERGRQGLQGRAIALHPPLLFSRRRRWALAGPGGPTEAHEGRFCLYTRVTVARICFGYRESKKLGKKNYGATK